MGREIFAQIRNKLPDLDDENYSWDKDANRFWESNGVVCGRNDATGYICTSTDESGCFAVLEGDNLKSILEALKRYAKEDHDEIDMVRNRLKRLRKAQQNARNYEEFNSFDEEIDNCKSWLKSEAYSPADHLLEMIDEVLKEYNSGKYDTSKCKPYLVVSE